MRVSRKVIVAVVTLLLLGASARDTSAQVCGRDFVAVAVWSTQNEGDILVLATEARVRNPLWFKRAPQWRFRSIPAGERKKRIAAITLSPDATYADVTYKGGAKLSVDLTEKLLQLPETEKEVKTFRNRPNGLTPEPCDRPIALNENRLNDQLVDFMAQAGYPPHIVTDDSNRVAPPWTYFSVRVDKSLYVPVLQLFKSEVVRPSAFEVWNDLVPPDVAATRGATAKVSEPFQASLFRRYQITEPACVIYYTDEQKGKNPGSWVVQYWFYYPFDVGGVGGHLHDSEHMFVEIDKLGGTVRRVAAAGHGMWAPNNIYHTFRPNAVPVSLPLKAIVEYGKHATAPDIDGDGWFTPGVDSNNYYDAAKVWGIRDTIGLTDSNVKPFAATMMVRRDAKYALFDKNFTTLFNESPGKVETRRQCELRELPKDMLSQKCDAATPGCARSQVGSHPDFQDPEKILKPAIYPPLALRASYSRMPTAERGGLSLEKSHRVNLGGAVELARFIGGMPGRLAVEAVIDAKDSDKVPLSGWSMRYEWLTSNLTGLYTGLSFIYDDLEVLENLEPGAADERPLWLSGGLLFEVPFQLMGFETLKIDRRLTFQAAAGLTYNNYFRLTWEARAGFSLSLWSPNRDFGIKRKTPNPY